MATVTRHLAATPKAVWAVLADGWTYSNWVVGTSHMRAVSADWPQQGATLLHASGAWPLVVRDETVVLASEPLKHLRLQARGRPFGEATIDLTLRAEGAGTSLTIVEVPTKGPASWVHNPIADLAIKGRNIEALARFAALAEHHRPEAGRLTRPAADGG